MKRKTPEEKMEAHIENAITACRPHLMSAWAEAVRAGHSGTFDDWLSIAFSPLADEAARAAESVPLGERVRHPFSPWARE